MPLFSQFLQINCEDKFLLPLSLVTRMFFFTDPGLVSTGFLRELPDFLLGACTSQTVRQTGRLSVSQSDGQSVRLSDRYLYVGSVSVLEVVEHGGVVSVQFHQVIMGPLLHDSSLPHQDDIITVHQVLHTHMHKAV